jgi:hypothetical protein
MSPPGSIPFDRAAEVYDETRRLTPEASAATTELLKVELGDRGPVLEIGVGTWLVGLPLSAAGVRLVGSTCRDRCSARSSRKRPAVCRSRS